MICGNRGTYAEIAHLMDEGDYPQAQGPKMWPGYSQLGCQQVMVSTLPTLCSRSSSYKQEVGWESLLKVPKKSEIPLVPNSLDLSQIQEIKTAPGHHIVKMRPPASCKPAEILLAFLVPALHTAPAQIKHMPGCHVSRYCIKGPNMSR